MKSIRKANSVDWFIYSKNRVNFSHPAFLIFLLFLNENYAYAYERKSQKSIIKLNCIKHKKNILLPFLRPSHIYLLLSMSNICSYSVTLNLNISSLFISKIFTNNLPLKLYHKQTIHNNLRMPKWRRISPIATIPIHEKQLQKPSDESNFI